MFDVVWLGALRSVFFLYTRTNLTRTYYLKPISNGYKHPCPKQDSNPEITIPNGSVPGPLRAVVQVVIRTRVLNDGGVISPR